MREGQGIGKDQRRPRHREGRGDAQNTQRTRRTEHRTRPTKRDKHRRGRMGDHDQGAQHGGGGKWQENLHGECDLVLGGPGETELGTGTKGNARGGSGAPATLAGRSRPRTSALIQQARGTGTNGSGGCRVTVRKREADRRTPHVLGGPGETQLGTGNKGRTPRTSTPGIGRAKTGQGQRGRPPSPRELPGAQAKGVSHSHAIFATPNF